MNSVDVMKRLEQIELQMSDPNKPINASDILGQLMMLAADISNAAKILHAGQCRKISTTYEVRVKEGHVEATFIIADEDKDDEEYYCVETKDVTYKGQPLDPNYDVDEETLDIMWDSACRLLKHPM